MRKQKKELGLLAREVPLYNHRQPCGYFYLHAMFSSRVVFWPHYVAAHTAFQGPPILRSGFLRDLWAAGG